MRRIIIGSIGVLLITTLSGCGPKPDTLSTDQQILRRVLQGLGSGNHAICVDNQARGGPLKLWHDSLVIARVAGRDLGWQRPTALRPPADMPQADSDAAKQGPAPAPLTQRARLPHQDTVALDAAINRLKAQPNTDSEILLRSSWMPAGVSARWWPLNRIASGCEPYRLSAPQQADDLAFVQVQSNHWGTVYALRKTVEGWRVVAQAAPWLY